MIDPPGYQLYPWKYGARCGNCKNLKMAQRETQRERLVCKFNMMMKSGWTCDDSEWINPQEET